MYAIKISHIFQESTPKRPLGGRDRECRVSPVFSRDLLINGAEE